MGAEFTAGACRRARPALTARAAPSVAGGLGPGDGGDAVWRAQPVRHRAVGPRTTRGGRADAGLSAWADAGGGDAASGLQSAGCGAVRDGAGAVGASRSGRSREGG